MAKREDLYSRWDKYDADAEIERMEEEERQHQLKEAMTKQQPPSTPADFLEKFPAKKTGQSQKRVSAAAALSEEPLRGCSEVTLLEIANELSLDPELIKLVARSLTLTDQQIQELPQEARFQTLRMRQAGEFEKVRFAIRRMAAEEQRRQQTAATSPSVLQESTCVKGNVPNDDPEVLTAMVAVLRMSDSDITALSEVEGKAARALLTDPKFAPVRDKVRQQLGLSAPAQHPTTANQPKPTTDISPKPIKDPIWSSPNPSSSPLPPHPTLEDTLNTVAAESGFDPQVVQMCTRAMRMTPEEIDALPYDARQKILMVRQDADFAPLREVAAQVLKSEIAMEEKLRARAKELDLDPDSIRSCALALQMTEEQVAALKTDRERDAIIGIRTGSLFASIREICYDLGLASRSSQTQSQEQPVPQLMPKLTQQQAELPTQTPASQLTQPSAPQPISQQPVQSPTQPPTLQPTQPPTPAIQQPTSQLAQQPTSIAPLKQIRLSDGVCTELPEVSVPGHAVPAETPTEDDIRPHPCPKPEDVELCRKALQLTESQLQALPPDIRANFQLLRSDPEFEALRKAVQQLEASHSSMKYNGLDGTEAQSGSISITGEQQPKWRLRHGSGNMEVESTAQSPQQVVAIIELPLLDTLEGVEVTVTERQLYVFKAGIYKLDLCLPYEVDTNTTRAKWLRKQRALHVTMTKLTPSS